MGTPWDRAARGYVNAWIPRFMPYYGDVLAELTLHEGDRVLVPAAGPGAEAIAAARIVGATGHVRALDVSADLVSLCREQIAHAGFEGRVVCDRADASDARGGPWDAILCCFGLWQIVERDLTFRNWRSALAPHGKVAVMTWGPADPTGAVELLYDSLHVVEPSIEATAHGVDETREALDAMFAAAGFAMVRHTVVRHTLAFETAEDFVAAMAESCTWCRVAEELGTERLARVNAHFFDRVGGRRAPISFQPAATIALAALPGAEVELRHRPSLTVPKAGAH